MQNTYIAYLPEGFETQSQASERRGELITALRGRDQMAEALADELELCTTDERCELESCPECLRDFRIWLLREGLQIIEAQKHWFACSIVPKGFSVPPGELHTLDLERQIKRFRMQIARSDLKDALIIGGVDFSLNIHDNADALWQGHLYLLVSGLKRRELEKALRKTFKAEPTALRPFHKTLISGHRCPLSYSYKSVFLRRSGYVQGGVAKIRELPLKSPGLAEIAMFLGESAVGSRLILRGVKRTNSGRLLTIKMSSNKTR